MALMTHRIISVGSLAAVHDNLGSLPKRLMFRAKLLNNSLQLRGFTRRLAVVVRKASFGIILIVTVLIG